MIRLICEKKNLFIVEFKKQTEEKLQKKLESAKENRERVLQAKIEKAKLPIEKGLATVQQNLAKLEEERQLLQEKINQKLNTAETSKPFSSLSFRIIFFVLFKDRQEQLDRLMEKLNEHDKKIEAIYTVLENDIEHTHSYSPEEIKKFYERREEHLAGKTETYTMEEAHQYIRQQKK